MPENLERHDSHTLLSGAKGCPGDPAGTITKSVQHERSDALGEQFVAHYKTAFEVGSRVLQAMTKIFGGKCPLTGNFGYLLSC
jgi:hypothetical protein